jgi:hypothetical protein
LPTWQSDSGHSARHGQFRPRRSTLVMLSAMPTLNRLSGLREPMVNGAHFLFRPCRRFDEANCRLSDAAPVDLWNASRPIFRFVFPRANELIHAVMVSLFATWAKDDPRQRHSLLSMPSSLSLTPKSCVALVFFGSLFSAVPGLMEHGLRPCRKVARQRSRPSPSTPRQSPLQLNSSSVVSWVGPLS